MKVVKAIALKEMPFDKGDGTGFGLIHATGYYVEFDNGTGAYEYEDSDFEYAEDCVFESEWDYEE